MPGILALPGNLPDSLGLQGKLCTSQPPTGTALCGVCQQSYFKYTCPRCEVLYCSLPCYQRHSDKCTEGFYQQQVQDELHSQKATGEERKRLEQIVSQMNRLDEEDPGELSEGEAEEDLARRLEELATKAESGELAIEDLTEEEARMFHSEIKRGSLGRLLNPWQPWWQRAGVVEVDPTEDAEDAEVEMFRPGAPPQHICCPGGRQPHESVALTALSVLYAYVHTMRVFNGEWQWAPMEAAPQLLHLCPAIYSHQVYSSAKEVLHASLDAATSLPGRGFGSEFDLLCLADVSAIIRGGADFSAHALGQTLGMLEGCLAGGHGRRAKLQRGIKKLEFLASFVFHHANLLEPFVAVAEKFAQRHEQENRDARDAQSARDTDGMALPER
jgi:hypothetical protein